MMRICNIVMVIGLICAYSTGVFAEAKIPCEEVKNALLDIHRQVDPDLIDQESLMDSSFELRFCAREYSPLVLAMSNNWQAVFEHLNCYATNTVDRLLLMNTGWWCGQDIYVGYLDALSDLVVSNQISVAEFDSFEAAAWNRPEIASVTYRRHGELSVSNILVRIMSFSQRTNHWRGVFSGEAARRYDWQVREGLWQ